MIIVLFHFGTNNYHSFQVGFDSINMVQLLQRFHRLLIERATERLCEETPS